MTRSSFAYLGLAVLVLGSAAWTVPASAQIACGTYGADARSTTSGSCPGGGGGTSCSHNQLSPPLLDCTGTPTGASCTWTSEVSPVGGCATCAPMANACSPRICAASICGSGSYWEVCDGFDNDGGGQVDEGCPLPDYEGGGLARVSMVHAATGQLVPPARTDVDYAGSAVPMTFSRAYTSLDSWPYELGSRMGAGWFHTYDERLYDGGTLGTPTSGSAVVIHRAGARGRRFSCSGGVCGTNDGSLDTLTWISGGSYWSMKHTDGVSTDFFGTGASWKIGALWRRQNTRGAGWTVNYTTGGALDGYILNVTDHLGRRLDFDWQPAVVNGAPARLIGLKDKGGGTLATFTYAMYARLASATSAAGAESYGYWVDGSGRTTRLLKTITIGAQNALSVTYDVELGEGWQGRVATIQEASASLRVRYRSATRNACAVPAETTMIVDRSTAPVGQSSCTDNASGDAWCASQAGMAAVCDVGLCRAIACERYGDLVGGAGEDRVTAITGNCPCGGVSTMGWVSGGSEAPRRTAWELSRDAKTTTYAYDSRGRTIARCDKDSDTTVTTTSSSCPTAGTWNAWEYSHSLFTTFVTKQHARSRLDGATETTITLAYDASHAELTQQQQVGLTRNAANDTNTTETQTTSYVYDSSGRLTQETLPAGEVTSFSYYSTAGNQLAMPQTAERWLNGGAVRLITTFSSYSALGRPQTVTAPNAVATTYSYAYGGSRLLTRAVAGKGTTYSYNTGTGRLEELIEPSGRRIKYTYDGLGRTQYEDVRDAQASLAADRTEYVYDVAGRRTKVMRRRLDANGNALAVAWQIEVTYDERGTLLTQKYGARSAIQHQLDPNGMGRVTQTTREDGDQVAMSYDAFGRELEYRRYITQQSSGAYTSAYANPGGNETGGALVSSITDPHAVVRSYVSDDFARLVKSSSNDHGTIRWGYATGRLTEQRISSGKRTTYSYDALGRITQIDHDADNPSLIGQDYRFVYDNGDGAVACGIAGSTCPYRKGRLALARMEATPGVFWDVEQDYAQDGQVSADRWPSSRQTNYTFDAQGRLLRVALPVATGDMLRYEYDATDNDGEDPSELRRVVHELTAGQDYVVWARGIQHDSLGHQVKAWTADRADGTSASVDLVYNTDSSVGTWRLRRRSSTVDVDMMNRTYSSWPDGALKGWTSSVTADPGRTFFWDGANRLTCAASVAGVSACPTDATRLESYTYDVHENRLTKVTPAGTTTYSNPYTNNQLYDEYPPNNTIWYGYDANTFGTRSYDVHQSVATSNQRTYYAYASGRLRSISMYAPGPTQGVQQQHTFTFLYDHRGRLVYAADMNNATSKERREQLYWDTRDRLIERVITPDHTASTTYSVDILAELENAATGWMRLEYVGGAFSSETRRYALRDPVGLVSSVYSFTGVGATTSVYTADHLPFGEVRTASSTTEPGLSMYNQVALTGTAARVWQGQTTVTLRAQLSAERARIWDARVSQHIGASAGTVRGGTEHPYSGAPPSSLASTGQRDGRLYIGPSTNPAFASEGRCGDFFPPTARVTGVCDFCPSDRTCTALMGIVTRTEWVCRDSGPPFFIRICGYEDVSRRGAVGHLCEGGPDPATFNSESTEGYWASNCVCVAVFPLTCPRPDQLLCEYEVVSRGAPRPRRVCDSMRMLYEPSWGDPSSPAYVPDFPDVPGPYERP